MPVVVPGNLPQFTFLVAFNNAAFDDPAAITTVASPAGTLGAANVWTDISLFVRHASWARGKQREVGHFETGAGSLTLLNVDGRFNTWNTSSPYTGKLKMGLPFRIQATVGGTTYVRFTGQTKMWKYLWPGEISADVQLDFTDAFAQLAITTLYSGAYAAQVLTDGATHYWKLNDGAGASFVADSHPTGFIGTARTGVNAVQFGKTAGPKLFTADTAANFGQLVAAGNACWVDVTGTGFSGAGAWSVEFWVQVTSPNAGQFWVSQAPTSGTANQWYVGLQATQYPLVNAAVFNNASSSVIVTGGGGTTIRSAVTDGNWHHVVVTYSGTTLKLYVDNYLDVFGTASLSTVALDIKKSTLIGSGATPATLAIGGFNISDVAFYSGVTLTAAQVANHYQLGLGVDQAGAGTQIGRILDAVGWPAGARSLNSGSVQLQPNQTNQSTAAALSYLQRIEESEGGELFMNTAGQVQYISRRLLVTRTQSRNVQATFGDNVGAGEFPFEAGPDLALDDLDLWNTVSVARNGGAQQVATDSASVTSYGPHVLSLSGLLHNADSDALYEAQWLLDRFKQPVTRLRQLILRPAAVASPAGMPAAILARELMDRVQVNRANTPGAGTAFAQTALLEKVSETVDFKTSEWTITLGLSPTDIKAYWALADATLGLLGTTTVAGW